MVCTECRAEIPEDSQFCSECGKPVVKQTEPVPVRTAMGRVGYSDLKVAYPEMTRHLAKSKKIGKVAVVLMGIIPFFGFVGYSLVTEEIPFDEAVVLGAVLAAIFMVFGLFFAAKEKDRYREWTGTVVDKKVEMRKEKVEEFDEIRKVMVKHLIMTIRREDCSKPEIRDFGAVEGPYGYYKVGDRIKHHAGTYHFEKYDKQGDGEVICVMCGGLYEMDTDTKCGFCKLPLLKG